MERNMDSELTRIIEGETIVKGLQKPQLKISVKFEQIKRIIKLCIHRQK
jgi:hypothetical protein